jgi:hypothetical protein
VLERADDGGPCTTARELALPMTCPPSSCISGSRPTKSEIGRAASSAGASGAWKNGSSLNP